MGRGGVLEWQAVGREKVGGGGDKIAQGQNRCQEVQGMDSFP